MNDASDADIDDARRLELGAAVILYEPSWAGNLLPAWFDHGYWEQRAAVRGRAGGRGTTWFVAAGDRQLALRHYRRGGLIAKLSSDRYVWLGESRSRPAREFAVHRELQRRGLPVPALVGVRISRDGWSYRGDILTERLPDVQSLAQRLAEAPLGVSEWVALGRCLRRFHDAGLDHADSNAHNILWRVPADFPDRLRPRAVARAARPLVRREPRAPAPLAAEGHAQSARRSTDRDRLALAARRLLVRRLRRAACVFSTYCSPTWSHRWSSA
ncbi:MAG: 3-deoxy-D-manno-octulosonic acid kinase [Steroidobacteraceae bacterium]